MQTPGSSARPARRCGKPKRFDDSDIEDEPIIKTGQQRAVKRKVSFSETDISDKEKPQKRPKLPTPKALALLQSASSQKVGLNSTQEKVTSKPQVTSKPPAIRQYRHLEPVEDDNYQDENETNDQQVQMAEEGDDEDMEGALTEYRSMCQKPVVDMMKDNAAIHADTSHHSNESLLNVTCRDCDNYKVELEHLEEMIKLKDCELQEILKTINNYQGGQKQEESFKDNLEKRILYHKKFQETDKKLRNSDATKDKYETLFHAEAGKVKDLELKCEALELKLKLEQRRNVVRKPGCIEVPATKVKELMEIKTYHSKNCFKVKELVDMLMKEKNTSLKSIQKTEIEYRSKFSRMKKHFKSLLDHYIQRDIIFSKKKELLDKKMSMYKDVGTRQQLLRDAAKFLNANQVAFLDGQLTSEKTLCGKQNGMPLKYKELLLSLYQNSIIAYKVLKSYNFNIPPVLSMQQLAQSEVCSPSHDQFTLLNERSNPVPADRRTLHALASEEEDQEIADLLDASAKQQQEQSIMSDEEAEDGVDGDYGDVQPDEVNAEEEEEGGAEYLSDDEPSYATKHKDESAHGVLEQQQENFQTDLQDQLDHHQLTDQFTADPQFETLVEQEVHSLQQVDSMGNVVQEVTHVDELVDSIEEHQLQHQIEISDMANSMSVVTTPVEMVTEVDAEHMLNMHVTTNNGTRIVVTTANDNNGLEAIAAAAVADAELISSMQASTDIAHEEVNSAETDVAERGPDMPLL